VAHVKKSMNKIKKGGRVLYVSAQIIQKV